MLGNTEITKAETFFEQLIERHIDDLNDDKLDFYFMMQNIILFILMDHHYWFRIELNIYRGNL